MCFQSIFHGQAHSYLLYDRNKSIYSQYGLILELSAHEWKMSCHVSFMRTVRILIILYPWMGNTTAFCECVQIVEDMNFSMLHPPFIYHYYLFVHMSKSCIPPWTDMCFNSLLMSENVCIVFYSKWNHLFSTWITLDFISSWIQYVLPSWKHLFSTWATLDFIY